MSALSDKWAEKKKAAHADRCKRHGVSFYVLSADHTTVVIPPEVTTLTEQHSEVEDQTKLFPMTELRIWSPKGIPREQADALALEMGFIIK